MSNAVSIFCDQNKFSKLNQNLHKLFAQKCTRDSTVYVSNDDDSAIMEFACQIYKRGISTNLSQDKASEKQKNTKRSNITKANQGQFDLHLKKIDNRSFFIIVDNFFFLSDKTKNTFYLEATEKNKNLTTIYDIISHIEKTEDILKIDHIIGFGGGITLDIAGFVASILQKKLSLIPTTLLAMIDATIGGKNGVNFMPYGKNQVGSFYFPDEIIIAPHFLSTLPKQQIISGLCEAIKHSWIGGNFIEYQHLFYEILNSGDTKKITTDFILNNIAIKQRVVESDPYEKTQFRSILNFGHTIGHALETLCEQTGQPMTHGIAIAYGMLFVLENFMHDESHEHNEFVKFLELIAEQYPVNFDKFTQNAWSTVLQQDKKNKKSQSVFLTLPSYNILNVKDFGMFNKNIDLEDLIMMITQKR